MRLYPPAYGIGREAARPTEVAGQPVPAGGIVIMPTWVVHRDVRWFNEPEAFRPERWADDVIRRLPRFAYFPFGGARDSFFGDLKVHGRDAFEFYTDKKVTITRWL